VQAVGTLIDGQLPQIRFQLSECANWIETSGRIAWTSESKKVAGLEFVGLPEQAREQIREWMSLDARLGRYPEEVNPTEQIVNLPTAGELASGNCLSESETSQTRPSVPSARTSVASSETL
jgi:hypothetical protein